ncbi:hypothetical protein Tco_1108059 [Tanacetum coccineum]
MDRINNIDLSAFDAQMKSVKEKDAGISGVSQPRGVQRMPIRGVQNPNPSSSVGMEPPNAGNDVSQDHNALQSTGLGSSSKVSNLDSTNASTRVFGANRPMHVGTNLNRDSGAAGTKLSPSTQPMGTLWSTGELNMVKNIGSSSSSTYDFWTSNAGDHARDSTFVGRTSQTGVRDTDTSINPNMDSFPEGDHVRVSNFAGRSSSIQNYPHTNVTGNFTSLGESTNPSFSTVNPINVKAQYPKPFEPVWNSGDESFGLWMMLNLLC